MKILTANRLTDGEAVWFAKDGSWAESIVASEVVGDKDGEARLEAIGKAAYENNEVVDVNLIDVDVIDGEIVPQRLARAYPRGRPDQPHRSRQTGATGRFSGRIARNGRTRPGRRNMYRYDEFDHDFVQARVAEFSDQVEPPPCRRDHRGPVPAAPPDERRLSAAARLYAAHRRALRHAELEAAQDARPHRPQIRQGLWPFHHAPEHPVQLAGAVGHAGDPRRPRLGRDARHPDVRATASAT